MTLSTLLRHCGLATNMRRRLSSHRRRLQPRRLPPCHLPPRKASIVKDYRVISLLGWRKELSMRDIDLGKVKQCRPLDNFIVRITQTPKKNPSKTQTRPKHNPSTTQARPKLRLKRDSSINYTGNAHPIIITRLACYNATSTLPSHLFRGSP